MPAVDNETQTVCCAQVSAAGFTERGSAPDMARLSETFERQRAVVLGDFLSPDLHRLLESICRAATFEPQSLPGLGVRRVETPGRAADALCLMLVRPRLLRWIEGLTGCGPLGGVAGDVVQLHAGRSDGLGWHDDGGRGRRLGLTINLGAEPYEGGQFELRRAASGEVIFRHQHHAVRAAALFEVGPSLEHRVSPLVGGGPRTVFTGWFLSA